MGLSDTKADGTTDKSTDRPSDAESELAGAAQKQVEIARSADLVFVGDVMFGRYNPVKRFPNPTDDASPFEYVKDLLKADLAVANLETPLLVEPFAKCPWPSRLRFAADKSAARYLKDAGFHAVSVANNHVFDMRNAGIRDTAAILAEVGLVSIGAPVTKGTFPFRIVPMRVNGQTFALIGFNTVRNSIDGPDVPDMPYTAYERQVPELLAPVIAEARAKYDRVIVAAHWGVSGVPSPSAPRKAAARKLIDLGADAVISHHPHVLQGVEIYHSGLIAYSLGDFLFDRFSDDQRLSGSLRVTYTPGRKCPSDVRFHPAVATRGPSGIFPKPVSGGLFRMVKERLASLSKPFGTVWERTDDTLVLKLPSYCE